MKSKKKHGFQADRERILRMHMRQLEHVNRQIEARDIKEKHTATRVNWLQRQKNANYRNEYDRVRGELGRNNVPNETIERLKSRESALRKLIFA